MAKTRAHVLIEGIVQGVSFRYYTMQEAKAMGVRGWVRNLWDGRVEAVFEGEESTIQSIVDWCSHGPPSARVDDLKVEWGTPTGEFESFIVRLDGSPRET